MYKRGINRKIKDTVFTALFKISKYKLLLYKALNPKEKDITETDIRDNVLSEFLQNHMEEVVSIETMLFDQDYVTEMYERELFEEGKAEGKTEGITKTIIALVKKGLLNINDAAKELNISEKDLKKLLVV